MSIASHPCPNAALYRRLITPLLRSAARDVGYLDAARFMAMDGARVMSHRMTDDNEIEAPAIEPDPPYVDGGPAAEPTDIEEADPVPETDPTAETAAGTDSGTEETQ